MAAAALETFTVPRASASPPAVSSTISSSSLSIRRSCSVGIPNSIGLKIQQTTRYSISFSCRSKIHRRAGRIVCDAQKVTVEASALPTAVSLDESLILKKQSEKVEPFLDGRCIYLVGMMGSGKTTVGRVLAEVLGYSFFDCDALIEQAVGGTSVAEIFKLYGEAFFRDNETEVLHRLSSMRRLVVPTGGGAVVRPINWKYMHKGISIWLDVPLEALAQRIAAVGTDSRPLLHGEAGDAYTKAFKRLTALSEERGDAYANANARVSLENVAMKLGCQDVCNLTPTAIAIEALVQIEDFLSKQ